MVVLNAPQSGAVYFKIQTQYKRLRNDEILEATGDRRIVATIFLKHCLAVKKTASFPSRVLTGNRFTFTSTDFPLHDKRTILRTCEAEFAYHINGILMILEADDQPPSSIFGAATPATVPMSSSVALPDSGLPIELPALDEYEYFALVFLSQDQAAIPPSINHESAWSMYTQNIIKLFENHLLSHHPEDDRWSEGRNRFLDTLSYFIERQQRVQFVLPAFPCKSTNPRKTSGSMPDGTEHEAFIHLHQFCIALQKIYPPGADFIIVSDGHVFSDCIGTHDHDVYGYTDATARLSDKVYHASRRTSDSSLFEKSGCCVDSPMSMSQLTAQPRSPIRFVNLHDIFHPQGADLLDRFQKVDWSEVDLYHPLESSIIHPLDDECRKKMMRSCGFDAGMLEKLTKDDPNHSITKTMCGFKKFMEKDLAVCPDMIDVGKSQRSKIAEKVAREMIKRNQAYSHLVELIHPRALRISIHQHKNHGPKFAINLLPTDRFRPIKSLKTAALYSAADTDHAEKEKVADAHIPTPWHNVLVEIEGDDKVYICEAGVVQDELADEDTLYDRKASRYDEKRGRYTLKYASE